MKHACHPAICFYLPFSIRGTRAPWKNGYFQDSGGEKQDGLKYLLVSESKEVLEKW